MVTAVVGTNWGDEGKGKITDMLASQADVVIRFQGGANAGHTIVNEYGKFALHTLPSGIFHEGTVNVLAAGMALDIDKLTEEINRILLSGVPMPYLMISDRINVVMPYHVELDRLEEQRLAGRSFGSTQSGIAPLYSDKYAKIGWQINEFYQDDDILREKISRIADQKNILFRELYGSEGINCEELLSWIREKRELVREYVCDIGVYLDKAIKEGKSILLEGQLGTLKDPDNGIYPMVTSSSPLARYGAISAGIPPYRIRRIIGVSKAYSSAVGAGEFVTELDGERAEELRKNGGDGGEYGATTGRPRRVGWYDCVASRYGCRLQGCTEVALTVLDILGYLDEIPVCYAYQLDGKLIRDFPVTRDLKRCEPVYKVFKGWKKDIRNIKKYEDLPEETREYVEFIEEQLGYPITMISNGSARDNIIYRNK